MIDKNYFFGKMKMLVQGALVSSVVIGSGSSVVQAMDENAVRIARCAPVLIVEKLCEFLSVQDICHLSEVNKDFYEKTKKALKKSIFFKEYFYSAKLIDFAKNKFFNYTVGEIKINKDKKFNTKVMPCFNNWLHIKTEGREKFLTFFYEKGLLKEVMDLAMFSEYSALKENHPWPVSYTQDEKKTYYQIKETNDFTFVNLYCYEMAAFCCKFNQLEALKHVLAREDFAAHRYTQEDRCHFRDIFTHKYSSLTDGSLRTIAKNHESDTIVSYFQELGVEEEEARNIGTQQQRKRKLSFDSLDFDSEGSNSSTEYSQSLTVSSPSDSDSK